MTVQKYKQSEVNPRYLYLVLADIVDNDEVNGVDVALARKRHAAYFKTKNGQPMDCYVLSYHFMTQEFSDVSKEEAETYLLEDYMEGAESIPDNITSPQKQASLLRDAYPKQEDLTLGASLMARLHCYGGYRSYFNYYHGLGIFAYWRDVFTLLGILHPPWIWTDDPDDDL